MAEYPPTTAGALMDAVSALTYALRQYLGPSCLWYLRSNSDEAGRYCRGRTVGARRFEGRFVPVCEVHLGDGVRVTP